LCVCVCLCHSLRGRCTLRESFLTKYSPYLLFIIRIGRHKHNPHSTIIHASAMLRKLKNVLRMGRNRTDTRRRQRPKIDRRMRRNRRRQEWLTNERNRIRHKFMTVHIPHFTNPNLHARNRKNHIDCKREKTAEKKKTKRRGIKIDQNGEESRLTTKSQKTKSTRLWTMQGRTASLLPYSFCLFFI
jgi:hypothetical protein